LTQAKKGSNFSPRFMRVSIILKAQERVGLCPMRDDGRLGEAERDGFDEVESSS
jgi:hypothetical protein